MWKHVKTELLPLTPELAKQHNALRALPGERGVRPRRREYLEARLEAGKLFTPKWAVVSVGGTMYRADGQASSLVLANANGEFPRGGLVCMDYFSADTLEDAADLFDQFNCVWSTRTSVEQIGAHGKTHIELQQVNSRIIRNAISGAAFAITVDDNVTMGTDEKARLVHKNVDFVLWYEPYFGNRSLQRTGVVAAMFLSYRRDRNRADEFWRLVRDESHADHKNPTRVLAKFLVESRASTTQPSRSSQAKAFSTRAFMVKCIHAWNAYFSGMTTELKYHPMADVPKLK